MLYLSKKEVLDCGMTDFSAVMKIIEGGFRLQAEDKVREPAKIRLTTSGQKSRAKITAGISWISTATESVYGAKILASQENNPEKGLPRSQGFLTLFHPETFAPLCYMDASVINIIRTAAVSALAARYLCLSSIKRIGLIGAGVQMRAEFLALTHIFPQLEEVLVFSRGNSKIIFCTEMSIKTGLTLRPVQKLSQVLEDVSLCVVAASDSCDSLITNELDQKTGITLLSLGHHDVAMNALSGMDQIITDSWEHIKIRKGHIITQAVDQGVVSENRIKDLSSIVAGSASGRLTEKENFFFSLEGTIFPDVLLAQEVYCRAQEKNLGTYLPL